MSKAPFCSLVLELSFLIAERRINTSEKDVAGVVLASCYDP